MNNNLNKNRMSINRLFSVYEFNVSKFKDRSLIKNVHDFMSHFIFKSL